MMTERNPGVLTLREVDASAPANAALIALSRERVVRVACSAEVPDRIAVATQNGFVQVIDSESGDYRIYCTFLGPIPLDAPVRCLSLVPGLYAATGGAQVHLAYSLSSSNELLLASTAEGAVTVLARCAARPSCVAADGDYITCGDGGGSVAAWRCWSAASPPQLLWRAELFDGAAVTCLQPVRGHLAAAAADCRCLVLSLDTGALVARLAQDRDPAVGLLPLTAPPAPRGTVAVCTPSSFGVFRVPAAPTEALGLPCAAVRLDTEVCCVSCCGGHLAAGTESGVVLVFSCDARDGAIEERVRFDVGYGVAGVQLYASGALLVVTTTGDVWRWPLTDLFAAPPADADAPEANEVGGEEEGEGEAPPEHSVTRIGEDSAAPEELAAASERDSDSDSDKGSNGSGASRAGAERRSESGSTTASHTNSEDKEAADEGSCTATSAAGAAEATPQPQPPRLAREASTSSSSSVTSNRKEDLEKQEEEEEEVYTSVPEEESSTSTSTSSSSSSEPPTPSTTPTPTATAATPPSRGRSEAGQLVAVEVAPPRPEPSALLKALGPAPTIEGLRRGRRMDPRRLASILQQEERNACEGTDEGEEGERREGGPLFAGAVSSAPLLQRQLEELEDVSFDYDAYRREHALEAEALRYRYPVIAPRFTLADRLFDSVTAPAALDGPRRGDDPDKDNEKGKDANKENVGDDLRALTYGRVARYRDPVIEEERRRGGPCIGDHHCEDLLFGGKSGNASSVRQTILFQESCVGLPPLELLPLPLPVPPTPAVY